MLIGAVRVYQWVLSPALHAVFGPLSGCRFEPTCSAYALEAVKIHGAFRGSWLAVRRLLRCHPWGGSGFDPVPHRSSCDCGFAAKDSLPSVFSVAAERAAVSK